MTDGLADMVEWLDTETDPGDYDRDGLVVALSEVAAVLGAATAYEGLDARVDGGTPGLVGRLRHVLRRALHGRERTVAAAREDVEARTPPDVAAWKQAVEARYRLLLNELRERPNPERRLARIEAGVERFLRDADDTPEEFLDRLEALADGGP